MRSGGFDDADRQLAFGVWYLEKEFNVGPIGECFPLMKFFNLLDEYNIGKYNKMMERDTPNSPRTLG